MPLFDSFRRAISTRDNQVNVDPHAWRLPSSYPAPKPGAKETIIPHPRIFAGALIPRQRDIDGSEYALAYPDIGHAAVHLALLQCFWNLRLNADALSVRFDQPPAYEEKPHTTGDTAPPERAESRRWDLLVNLAVTRFAAWWTNIDSVLRHANAYAHHGGEQVAVQLSKNYLPPLDVLLVWYALMVNTDAYRQSICNRPQLQQLCFPWPAIREVIDMEKLQFLLPKSAEALFFTMSTQSADIMKCLENPPAYTDWSTLPAGLNLAAEVHKCEKFIDQAHQLLWIRAPSLKGSLSRASQDYLEFQLSRDVVQQQHPNSLPFGVELLWKTHQLFPSHYQLFLSHVGLDQADTDKKPPGSSVSIMESSSVGSNAGSNNYCLCWTCERIRDYVPAYVHTTLLNTPNPSIAATSSAPPPSDLSSLLPDKIFQIQDDLGFYNAVEEARKHGKPLPTRPPTAEEKEAEKFAKERQKEAGYLPGLNEYIEVLPDGTKKVRRHKMPTAYGTMI